MSRAKKEIDWVQFKKLCSFFCTRDEIAGFFDVSPDTIERRVREEFDLTFHEAWKHFSANGKISLRRKQYEMALKGSVPLLVWLDKNHMGGRDQGQDRDADPELAKAPHSTTDVLNAYRLKRKAVT